MACASRSQRIQHLGPCIGAIRYKEEWLGGLYCHFWAAQVMEQPLGLDQCLACRYEVDELCLSSGESYEGLSLGLPYNGAACNIDDVSSG